MQRYIQALIAHFITLMVLITPFVNAQDQHIPLDKFQWTYDTDPYGSIAIINEKLIRHGGIWIKFIRVPPADKEHNTWAELIHKLPNGSLAGIKKISLTYQSEKALNVVLPQAEYGKNGDKSHAYYQAELPATKQWVTKELSLADFKRPHWTPENSNDLGIVPAHIKTINFVPQLSDKKGGEAIIQVRAIALLP